MVCHGKRAIPENYVFFKYPEIFDTDTFYQVFESFASRSVHVLKNKTK
jgi:hypothetical protein